MLEPWLGSAGLQSDLTLHAHNVPKSFIFEPLLAEDIRAIGKWQPSANIAGWLVIVRNNTK
jgi:hypothetical protein